MSNNKSRSTHVVPNKDRGGWDIKAGGGERSIKYFEKQNDAIDRARQISRNKGTELTIHGRDGRIREKDSHGNDPSPPRG